MASRCSSQVDLLIAIIMSSRHLPTYSSGGESDVYAILVNADGRMVTPKPARLSFLNLVEVTEESFVLVLLGHGHLMKARRQVNLREVPPTLKAGSHILHIP